MICFVAAVVVVSIGADETGSTVLLPELISCKNPSSLLDTGFEENTVLGSTSEVSSTDEPLPCVKPAKVLAADDGDNMGSSSPSAVSMLRRCSSRLGSMSGMMVLGLTEAEGNSPLL
jgi:hypothetical protein